MTFSWLTPLARVAYKKGELLTEDVYSVSTHESSDVNCRRYDFDFLPSTACHHHWPRNPSPRSLLTAHIDHYNSDYLDYSVIQSKPIKLVIELFLMEQPFGNSAFLCCRCFFFLFLLHKGAEILLLLLI